MYYTKSIQGMISIATQVFRVCVGKEFTLYKPWSVFNKVPKSYTNISWVAIKLLIILFSAIKAKIMLIWHLKSYWNIKILNVTSSGLIPFKCQFYCELDTHTK